VTIRWSDEALGDLRVIRDWIDTDSPDAASRQCDLILEGAEQLRHFKFSGPRSMARNTRRLYVPGTPYIIFYQPLEGAVDIMRIRHGAQRIPRGLRLR
jgi:plasmid stabilization system protein ParE